MTRLANEAEQAMGERLGRDLRKRIMRDLGHFMPPGVDAGTRALNVAIAGVQALALDAADDLQRLSFVEGVGIAMGIMVPLWRDAGGDPGVLLEALQRGLDRGRDATELASRPQGGVQ